MNLQENIDRINEMILKLDLNKSNTTYKEVFTIIDKKVDGDRYEYIVGDESPVGRFVIPSIVNDYIVPELYLENPTGGMEDSRNFFKCIGSLGSVLGDYVGDGNLPMFIIFNPSDDAHEKRYKSDDFINFIRGYIGNDYMYAGDHGINALWKKKMVTSKP
jgi:hypothetical protein